MSFKGVLVDRARILHREPMVVKVDGATQTTVVSGAWFDARLTVNTLDRQDDGSSVHERVVVGGSLMYAFEGDDGDPTVLTSEERVEVDSEQLGRTVFRLTNDPVPMRKKRSILGYEVNVTRVENHEFTEPIL